MTPNWFATLALLSWPVVVIYLYSAKPIQRATLWAILGAQLLLPVNASIKFEMVPSLDKNSIPNLAALGCAIVAAKGPSWRFWRGFGAPEGLFMMLLIGPFITSTMNGDTIRIGDITLPGVGEYDGLSAVAAQFIFWIPYLLGRRLFRSPADAEEILRVLVVAGLLYSLPMLFEIRMSPQLHTWIYGYLPGTFDQEVREGGYRPVVFLGHGLVVAFFTMSTAVSATVLWRNRVKIMRLPPLAVVVYLSAVLLMCKSLGSLIYGAALVPLVGFARPRLQLGAALALTFIALCYPILRANDLVPTDFMLATARSVSTDRADSLKTRFDQERQLLEHASQRFYFGWGRYGRSRVYDEDSGKDISITDGRWIIVLGTFGFFGFLAEFGLLALSVVRAVFAARFAASVRERVNLAALALIVAINLIDLLPNGMISPWICLLSGALLGISESLSTLRGLTQLPRRRATETTVHPKPARDQQVLNLGGGRFSNRMY